MRLLRAFINLAGITSGGLTLSYLMTHRPGGTLEAGVIVLTPLWTYPLSALGRVALNHRPNRQRAELATTVVHYLLLIPLAAAILLVTLWAIEGEGPLLPLPQEGAQILSTLFLIAGSILAGGAMLSLLLEASGLPFALALTRRLAKKGFYNYTRNPMVLGALLSMAGLALWSNSSFLLAWTLGGFLPSVIFFLKAFEERELEIRFGPSYGQYRAQTPFLLPWPRRG